MLHCWAASTAFLEKTLITVFQVFSDYSKKWFDFFLTNICNKVKTSQTWHFAMLENHLWESSQGQTLVWLGVSPYLSRLQKRCWLERCRQWRVQWIFSQIDWDFVSALEWKWMLCTVDNECVITSLDKKKNEIWQTCFIETFGGFCLLLRHLLYWWINHISTVLTDFIAFFLRLQK